MSVKFTLEDIDLGYDAMSKALEKMAGAKVETGLFDREEAAKGVWAEFGTERATANGKVVIKPRPWLSVVADNNKPAIGDAMVDATDDVLDGERPKRALKSAGEKTAEIAKSILGTNEVGGPALAQSTIDRKGHARKLVDTGAMRDAIESKVEVKP